MRGGRGIAACAAALCLLAGAARAQGPTPRAAEPAWRTVAVPPSPESVPTQEIEARPYLAVADLARLLPATRFWRSDVRKMVLRAGAHRLVLIADNPFVLLDDRTLRLEGPVRTPRGEWWVPVGLLDALPRDSTLARLRWEPSRRIVVVVPPSGAVGSPRVSVAAGITRVTLPADHPERAQVLGRARARFRVRVPGVFVGVLPDSLPADGLVRRLVPVASASGAAFELALTGEARGFRVLPDSAGRRLVLEFARSAGPGLESFAAEGATGPRTLRVIVLDPAHGGADAGVQAGGAVEKDLTLALAKLLKPELERRLLARVVLTREDDRALPAEARAEAANRARADLVLALHFDGFPAPAAHGASAYVPPATLAGESGGGPGAAPLTVLPWRDVALRHAVDARTLAEALLQSFELRDLGPTRLRETLPLGLLGVNAPGVSLECATLTNDADRARVTSPDGLAVLAGAIVDGIAAWQRNE